ncbi:MAG TPA: RICIN domain-containing protein [Puia sp.]|nr:RICIN domain-containing protein [Puia sp.]
MKTRILLLASLSLGLLGKAQTTVIKGDFALKNVHTGMYVRIKDANGANGTPIVAYSPVNWKCVTWEFKPTAEGSYTLRNLFSGKTLQPLHGEAKAGVAMEEQPMSNDKAQQYEVIAAGNDQYYVRLKGSDLYLTPSDPGGETNSSIVLQTKKEGDLQRWTLVEQHPTM